MKMEPIVSSETSAIRTQRPGNHPKRNNLHLERGESLRTRPLFLSDYNNESGILSTFSKTTQISNVMKVRPLGAELFHADGQTD